MIEAGAPNTGDCWHAFRGVRVPPGVDMLSPPEVPRNAERAPKRRPRFERMGVKRGL
jgi:hypothetical protein